MRQFDLSSGFSPGPGRGKGMRIWVSGSIARDLIMDFPGRFVDYIDPTKIHALNLSFGLENLQQNVGGTAGNIVYNLALLGERPQLIGAVGSDGKVILRDYRKIGIGTGYVRISKSLLTSLAYIMTDRHDNQITGFYKGAMVEKTLLPPAKRPDLGIIASGSGDNMAALAKHHRSHRVPYVFDPGQAITALTVKQMQFIADAAQLIIGNNYEIEFVRKKTRGLKNKVVVKTFGAKGSQIELANRKKIRIGIAKPRRVVDPTGAGDAYRAGFLKGLILGYNLKTCGQLGATVASFVVEEYGTQNHKFSWNTIKQRYKKNFRENLQ